MGLRRSQRQRAGANAVGARPDLKGLGVARDCASRLHEPFGARREVIAARPALGLALWKETLIRMGLRRSQRQRAGANAVGARPDLKGVGRGPGLRWAPLS